MASTAAGAHKSSKPTTRRSGLRSRLRNGYRWLECKPALILLIAATATIAAVAWLARSAGWSRVGGVVVGHHPWIWLVVCFVAEAVAIAGYVLTVRDMARVDDGAEMGLAGSIRTVVAGFGVYPATRASGGFALDFWAFQHHGATRREAANRAAGLGLLEYLVLSVTALAASVALFFGIDGSAGEGTTLTSLFIIPCLVLGLFLTSPKRADRLSRRKGGYLRRHTADLVAAATTVRLLIVRPREHGAGVLGHIAYWCGDIVCLWAALQIVHIHLSVAAIVVAYSGAYVLTRRSLPAGGAGAVEIALTFALVWMGAPFARTLVAVVIYRIFNFWLPILPALFLAPSVREMREAFQDIEAPS